MSSVRHFMGVGLARVMLRTRKRGGGAPVLVRRRIPDSY